VDTLKRSVAIARRDISSFEERWQILHQQAMSCRNWEEIAERSGLCFRLIIDTDEQLRAMYGTGDAEYHQGDDVQLFALFLIWHGLSQRVQNEIRQVAGMGFEVDCNEEFQSSAAEAQLILDAMGDLVESHPDAWRVLLTGADTMMVETSEEPIPSPQIADLLFALRQRNLREQELDEDETFALSDLKQYPGTILGELIDRRYRLWPTVTEPLWEKR